MLRPLRIISHFIYDYLNNHKVLLILIRIFDKIPGQKKKKSFPHSCNKDLEMETRGKYFTCNSHTDEQIHIYMKDT